MSPADALLAVLLTPVVLRGFRAYGQDLRQRAARRAIRAHIRGTNYRNLYSSPEV